MVRGTYPVFNSISNQSHVSLIRLTGFVTVKIGKAVAIAVGGSIILLQIANEQGYVKVNWDKLAKKTDKIMDKVEERVTGEGPNLLDKVRQHLFRDFIIA